MPLTPKHDLGKKLLQNATRVALWGLKQVPGIGLLVELGDEAYQQFRAEQEAQALEQRLQALEAAAAIPPKQARAIAEAVVAELRQQGEACSPEKAAAVVDLIGMMPAAVRGHTQATLAAARRHGTAPAQALPLSDHHPEAQRTAFYRSLFPARRPRFQSGDSLPHYGPDWRLAELIGSGGFGEVWLARNSLHEERAIKFCLDGLGTRLLKREEENLKTLQQQLPSHPNIVRLLDLNLVNEPYWLAFEYVAGGTLEDLMRARSFAWPQVLTLFLPIVEGMCAVHAAGLVHSDLKPANILLTPEEIPRITDFGIGKPSAQPSASSNSHTSLGYGSLGYLSPEQERGESRHPSDDTYALGVILWQLLASRLTAPRLQADIEALAIPEPAKGLLFNCIFQPRGQRIENASALHRLLLPLAQLPAAAPPDAEQQQLLAEQQREAEERRHGFAQILEAGKRLGQQIAAEAKERREQVYSQEMAQLAEMAQVADQMRQRGSSGAGLEDLSERQQQLRHLEQQLIEAQQQYQEELKWHEQRIATAREEALAQLGTFQKPLQDRFEKSAAWQRRVEAERSEQERRHQQLERYWKEALEESRAGIEATAQRTREALKRQVEALTQPIILPSERLTLELLEYHPDPEKMDIRILAEEVLPRKRLRIETDLSIPPQEAQWCWENYPLLVPQLTVRLASDDKLVVEQVGFITPQGGEYLATAEMVMEPSARAVEQARQEVERQKAAQAAQVARVAAQERRRRFWFGFWKITIPAVLIVSLSVWIHGYRIEQERRLQAGALYRDHGDGTVTDTVTGLQWMRCAVGQQWEGDTCSGEAKTMNWEAAKQERADFAGHSDWRLPTIEELKSLVYCSSGKPRSIGLRHRPDLSWNEREKCEGEYQRPTIDLTVFPSTPVRGFWSSSAYSYHSSCAWGVYFNYGSGTSSSRNDGNAVRLVRGGQ